MKSENAKEETTRYNHSNQLIRIEVTCIIRIQAYPLMIIT